MSTRRSWSISTRASAWLMPRALWPMARKACTMVWRMVSTGSMMRICGCRAVTGRKLSDYLRVTVVTCKFQSLPFLILPYEYLQMSTFADRKRLVLPDFNGHAELVAGATNGFDGRGSGARLLQPFAQTHDLHFHRVFAGVVGRFP